MTAGRRRKRQIRQRMAETGEPYSVAARAIADADVFPDGKPISQPQPPPPPPKPSNG